LAIIDKGRIVALDTPAELKRSVGADTTVRVVADGDLEALSQLLQREVAGAVDARVVSDAVLLGVNGTQGVLPSVVQIAERNGFHVRDLSVSEISLETVFITLTGKDLRE
jgi:ABC-2 type transport system ATP-binding protein